MQPDIDVEKHGNDAATVVLMHQKNHLSRLRKEHLPRLLILMLTKMKLSAHFSHHHFSYKYVCWYILDLPIDSCREFHSSNNYSVLPIFCEDEFTY